jgi:hypothetical protein
MAAGIDQIFEDQRQIARALSHGFEGEACQACGNFTLMSNGLGGTLLKCDTCNEIQKPPEPFTGEGVVIIRCDEEPEDTR